MPMHQGGATGRSTITPEGLPGSDGGVAARFRVRAAHEVPFARMKSHSSRPASFALVALSSFLALSCAKAPAPPAGEPAAAPGAPSAPLADAHGGGASAPVSTLTGTVLETMDAAGYTYLKLKTADGEAWAAVNESKVAVGDVVTVLNPIAMAGFESPTLNRTFDEIFFGTLGPAAGAGPAEAFPLARSSSAAAGTPAMPPGMAAQHASAAAGPEVTEKISVVKAEGPDGRTIAELFAQRAALNGKPVSIRGKVVKYNAGIMGKNWIHLRDGSGTPEGKDHDVTVTTNDAVAKGDVVLVKGVVAVDRDFGSGYTYALVVEDAKVTK